MASSNNKYTPFTYSGEDLDDVVDDTITIELESTKNSLGIVNIKVKDEMFILDSKLTNEKLIKAWMLVEKRILHRKILQSRRSWT